MEQCGGGAGKKVIEASAEAQRLALAAKHLGADPFQLYHGYSDEERPGSPRRYRTFLYAASEWLEDRERELAVETSASTALSRLFGGKPKRKRRRQPRSG
jgi:hypothetical protein